MVKVFLIYGMHPFSQEATTATPSPMQTCSLVCWVAGEFAGVDDLDACGCNSVRSGLHIWTESVLHYFRHLPGVPPEQNLKQRPMKMTNTSVRKHIHSNVMAFAFDTTETKWLERKHLKKPLVKG